MCVHLRTQKHCKTFLSVDVISYSRGAQRWFPGFQFNGSPPQKHSLNLGINKGIRLPKHQLYVTKHETLRYI